LVALCKKHNIILGHSSNYYPQGNGQVESSNINIMRVINKTLVENKKAWDAHLRYALWADRINTKSATWKAPF